MLAWILALLLLLAAWPWARWLAGGGDEADACTLPLLLTLALGSGALTLGMLWLGLAGVPFTLTNTSLLYLLLMAPGAWLWWRSGHSLPRLSLPGSRITRATLLLLLPVCLGVLFNSVWWPFSRADAVAIYERFSLEMLASGTLVPLPGAQTLYEAYPMHVPLGYTWSYLAAGWPNEFLARLFTSLPALGCLGAVWALAGTLRNRMTAALAALLLAFAPLFGNWASSGYVDLPAAFYTLLALLLRLAAVAARPLAGCAAGGSALRPGRLDQKRRPYQLRHAGAVAAHGADAWSGTAAARGAGAGRLRAGRRALVSAQSA